MMSFLISIGICVELFRYFRFDFAHWYWSVGGPVWGIPPDWAFVFLLFLACGLLENILRRFTFRSSGGIWTTRPGRWLIGRFASLSVFAASAGAIFGGLNYAGVPNFIGAAAGMLLAFLLRTPIKIGLGRGSAPFRNLLRSRHLGLGGSAQFAGIMEEWANPWRPGMILLGYSLYDRHWRIGIRDDRHVVTCATNRAGKGVSGLISNLLTWPGSAVIIDPKGQIAAVTAAARGHGNDRVKKGLGQDVYIVDPFQVLGKKGACFNPLDSLVYGSRHYVDRVKLIADALVIEPRSSNNPFFNSSSRTYIAGVIDYVKRSPKFRDDERHLGKVRDVMVGSPDVEDMIKLGGLAQSGVAQKIQGSKNSGGDIFSTSLDHTAFLDSDSIRETLSTSDFSMESIRNGKTTPYIVLPPNLLTQYNRFTRLFINLALAAMQDGTKGKHECLFMLDELYALGTLQTLSDAASTMAGYGVKLWYVIHTISQLKELYPNVWPTFLANAAQWQVFAMNDKETADYLSDRLGKRVQWTKRQGAHGSEWVPSGAASLRDSQELSRGTSRKSEVCAVFIEGGDTFLLQRRRYLDTFKKDQYDPDPMEKTPPGRMERLRATLGRLMPAMGS